MRADSGRRAATRNTLRLRVQAEFVQRLDEMKPGSQAVRDRHRVSGFPLDIHSEISFSLLFKTTLYA